MLRQHQSTNFSQYVIPPSVYKKTLLCYLGTTYYVKVEGEGFPKLRCFWMWVGGFTPSFRRLNFHFDTLSSVKPKLDNPYLTFNRSLF